MQISTYKSPKRANKHKKTVFMLKKGLDEETLKALKYQCLHPIFKTVKNGVGRIGIQDKPKLPTYSVHFMLIQSQAIAQRQFELPIGMPYWIDP